MLPELERSGDLAEHVSRRAVRGLGVELSPRARGLVEQMGEVACEMWRATADAYADRAPVADEVEELDDELDELHVTLTAEIASGSMPLPVAIEAALVARFYERFGDHAVNLARRIAVLVGAAPPTGATERFRAGSDLKRQAERRARRASAICTALRAAPLRRLSPETNSTSPWATVSSRRSLAHEHGVDAGGGQRGGHVDDSAPRAPAPAGPRPVPP